jgi:hypothetical protein
MRPRAPAFMRHIMAVGDRVHQTTAGGKRRTRHSEARAASSRHRGTGARGQAPRRRFPARAVAHAVWNAPPPSPKRPPASPSPSSPKSAAAAAGFRPAGGAGSGRDGGAGSGREGLSSPNSGPGLSSGRPLQTAWATARAREATAGRRCRRCALTRRGLSRVRLAEPRARARAYTRTRGRWCAAAAAHPQSAGPACARRNRTRQRHPARAPPLPLGAHRRRRPPAAGRSAVIARAARARFAASAQAPRAARHPSESAAAAAVRPRSRPDRRIVRHRRLRRGVGAAGTKEPRSTRTACRPNGCARTGAPLWLRPARRPTARRRRRAPPPPSARARGGPDERRPGQRRPGPRSAPPPQVATVLAAADGGAAGTGCGPPGPRTARPGCARGRASLAGRAGVAGANAAAICGCTVSCGHGFGAAPRSAGRDGWPAARGGHARTRTCAAPPRPQEHSDPLSHAPAGAVSPLPVHSAASAARPPSPYTTLWSALCRRARTRASGPRETTAGPCATPPPPDAASTAPGHGSSGTRRRLHATGQRACACIHKQGHGAPPPHAPEAPARRAPGQGRLLGRQMLADPAFSWAFPRYIVCGVGAVHVPSWVADNLCKSSRRNVVAPRKRTFVLAAI